MTLSADDFELLLQSNRILSSKLDTDEVLQAVMELAAKVVRAEAASLFLLDEAAGELYVNVALGRVKESVMEIRLKVGEGIAGWVAKERTPLIVNDVSSDSRFTRRVDQSTRFQTRSALAVPLIAKGRLIGVVEAINKENKGAFSEVDREAFEIFASQSAIAIENARLFSAVVQEREKLNTIFDRMSEGVLLLDALGRIRLINPAASRFLGFDAASATGRDLASVFPTFSAHPALALPDREAPVLQSDLVRRGTKDLFLTALVRRLISDAEPSADGFLLVLRDVTEERRGERLKRNFLSLVSHKLKTPLTVILGYAPVILAKAENLTEPQRKAVKAINDQGEQLSGLVDKLLRFSIMDSEAQAANAVPCSIAPLIEEAIEAVPLVASARPAIEIDTTVAVAPEAAADPRLAVEVFKNVLENAVKFNDKSRKEIRISAAGFDDGVVVRIADNGVGIPPEERENVFKTFHQIENSFTGQVPGAGLGLALCKKAMAAMGGGISLESEIGKGTAVSIRFPRGAA